MKTTLFLAAVAAALAIAPGAVRAQQPPRPPQFASLEVAAERKITFRIFAPKAADVRLSAGDVPGVSFQGGAMRKREDGVWETTVGPVPAGAYRYQFSVDGVATLDPRNPATSESVGNSWSLAVVPGADLMDVKDVPHGAVARVTYPSTSLGRPRRMTVYTPPGYEKGTERYPVFYLLHGAGDSDDSWTSVGRAGYILDNLIASGKARPMIVVMPAGHTRALGGGSPLAGVDEFGADFVKDLMPYVEANYRTRTDRGSRAIAGLSMGGFQTLNVAFGKLDAFAYVGVMSSGLFGIVPMGAAAAAAPTTPRPFPWEEQHKATLDDPKLKKGLKLLWLGCGSEDFLLATHKATVALFERHGFTPVHHATGGGHTWLIWRDYLIDLAPRLFR